MIQSTTPDPEYRWIVNLNQREIDLPLRKKRLEATWPLRNMLRGI